ncbi:hypothetical protein A3Q29_12220 [Providencia stuartii]|uniref:Uncharacterized protein n=1 Tax=Providencia stuartii TaxID=588 RepID=A0A1S1HWL3_PROST|nr:hypothetical protein A3Q29_12220 [Providencia stuartii]
MGYFLWGEKEKTPHTVGKEDTKNIINNGLGEIKYNYSYVLKNEENMNKFIIDVSYLDLFQD